MVEDIPDDLVHEVFAASFWPEHPLGRSILGSPDSVTGISREALSEFFTRAYVSGNLIVDAMLAFETLKVAKMPCQGVFQSRIHIFKNRCFVFCRDGCQIGK